MTEAEKAQFYATILAGMISTWSLDDIDEDEQRVVARVLKYGDELLAQLIERRGPEF